ncbi:MAG: FAD-dependent oxidoreductase [Candidatus Sumerlaeia bacterium]
MKKKYDVIVAGSGPAGFAAAYYAAKNGADTLLIERNGTLGGTLTTGHMGVFCGTASSGLFTEIKEKLCIDDRIYDVEMMRQFLYEKAEEVGLNLLLHAFATGVKKEVDAIECLEVHAKEGRLELTADVYIDATGDGDVAAFAGEEFSLGREDDGKFQPMTLIFALAGVDRENAPHLQRENRWELSEKLHEWVERGDVDEMVGHVIMIRGYRPDTVKINMTNVIDLDATRSEDLTRAEVLCRKQLAQILAFLRAEAPGFENCYVVGSAEMVGVRSARHAHGQYILNEKDISEGRIFDDWAVAQANYVWGTHNLYGPMGGKNHNLSKKSKYGDNLPHDKPYTIPFRSLRPAKTDNLLLAGRCISGTFMAHSNYRVMPICIAMGQGAGTAAAMASKKNSKLDELDIKSLQETLMEQGVENPNMSNEQ